MRIASLSFSFLFLLTLVDSSSAEKLSDIQATQGGEDAGKASGLRIQDKEGNLNDEDDHYWSRLVQQVESMSMPTPSPLPLCDIDIESYYCRSRDNPEVLCEDMPRPSSSECTNNTGLEFIYNNCTCECSDNDQEETFTCIEDETCVTEETMLVTCIGDGEVFCNCTVIDGEKVIIQALLLPEQLTCSIINPTSGQVCQEFIFDPTGNVAKLQLEDKFGSLTVSQCTGDEDLNCVPAVEYLYTLKNVGSIPLKIDSLNRTCDGEEETLDPAAGAIFAPGSFGTLSEPSFIDVCRTTTIEKSAHVAAVTLGYNDRICEDDAFLTIPAPPFFPQPPPPTPSEADEPVAPSLPSSPTTPASTNRPSVAIGDRTTSPTTPAVTNPPSAAKDDTTEAPTNPTLTNPPSAAKDDTTEAPTNPTVTNPPSAAKDDTTEAPTNPTVTNPPSAAKDDTTEAPTNPTVTNPPPSTTSAITNAPSVANDSTLPPSDDDTGAATIPPTTIIILPPSVDSDLDTPAPSSDSGSDEGDSTVERCDIRLRTRCESDDSRRPGDCSWISPVVLRSHSQASQVMLRYKGGSCSNTSPFHIIDCSDYEGGPPTDIGEKSLVNITDASGNVYFTGIVAVGDTITIEPDPSHAVSDASDALVTIFTEDGDTVLQQFEFESGCWARLYLADRFASMDIAGFTVGDDDTSSYFYEAEFTYDLQNESEDGDVVVTSLEIAMGELGSFDLTDQVETKLILPGQTISVSMKITIDLSEYTRYQSQALVRGIGTMSKDTYCLDVDVYDFGPEQHY